MSQAQAVSFADLELEFLLIQQQVRAGNDQPGQRWNGRLIGLLASAATVVAALDAMLVAARF